MRSFVGLGAVAVLFVSACGHKGGSAGREAGRATASGPAICAPGGARPLGEPHVGSTVVLARVGERAVAYVADADDGVIHIVDATVPTELATIPVAGHPSQLLMLPDGRLLAAIRDAARVDVLVPSARSDASLTHCGSIATPVEPVGLATTPDGSTLLVTSAWAHTLTAYETKSTREVFHVDLPREPRAVVVSGDGERAFVSHVVGARMSVVDLATRAARSIDLVGAESAPLDEEPRLMSFGMFSKGARPLDATPPRARRACQGYALARVAGAAPRIVAPEVMVDTGDTSVRPSGYGDGRTAAEVESVAVVDESTGVVDPDSLEVEVGRRSRFAARHIGERPACLLPRAAMATSDSLYVACLGIDAVIEYDATAASPAKKAEVRRWHVPSGPSGVALAGEHMYVWSQFARTFSVLDLHPTEKESTDVAMQAARDSALAPTTFVALSRKASVASAGDVALGRELFHMTGDSRISSDGRACASCHPDGRDDALTWATPEGPRQTPMLAGRVADTAPYGWDAKGPDFETHLTHTFQRLSGRGLPAHAQKALVAYLTTLAPPVPAEMNATGEQLARGGEIFHSKQAECSTCHQDGALTDRETHDVGTKTAADVTAEFDTPSLRFVGGTGPYFHDGRYATLGELLARSDGEMGHTGQLSPEELAALEAYLRAL